MGFKRQIDVHFHLAEMTILDREHQPPQFWNARCAELPTTPNNIDTLTTDRLNRLVGMLPCAYDVRSAGVAVGIINEQTLTLRRFTPDTKGELPHYAIIPYRGKEAEREDKARQLVWKLTDLEASAAAQLFDIVTNLEMYDSHLRVYRAIAHQAEELWDQLALYLPVKKGRHLARVHRLIELVHQTLLQGIADLDQMAIRIDEEVRKVERLRSALRDQFDQRFTERPLPLLQPHRRSAPH